MISPVLPVYRRCNIRFTHGEGVYLYADNQDRYVDFAAGIAVHALGHCHPHVVNALQNQAEKLWHTSNLYEIQGLPELAARLVKATFADTAFFCNSGAEAVECGIKMLRKYQHDSGHPERYRIITFRGAFHGRTLATIFAGDRNKPMEGFYPAVPGFDNIPFGDLSLVKQIINRETAGILVEPIQGEGGVLPATKEYLQGLRQLCDEHGLLLFFDEIQCGMGRSGKLFAHEWSGITPDIMSVAKGIGNGFPLGACLATEKAASCMTPGSHGSTYGGNPLAMAVGNAVLDVILKDGFLAHVEHISTHLLQELEGLKQRYPNVITDIRGKGLMIGVKVKPDNREMVDRLRAHFLLTAPAADNVIRILPPLVITETHVAEAIKIFEAVCKLYP